MHSLHTVRQLEKQRDHFSGNSSDGQQNKLHMSESESETSEGDETNDVVVQQQAKSKKIKSSSYAT